jgi:hypothetical protein
MPNITLRNTGRSGPLVQAHVGPSARLISALPPSSPEPPRQVVWALLDTGAERTFVAETALRRIGLSPTGTTSIRSMSTGTSPALRDTYEVSLGLAVPTAHQLFDNFEIVEGGFETSGSRC